MTRLKHLRAELAKGDTLGTYEVAVVRDLVAMLDAANTSRKMLAMLRVAEQDMADAINAGNSDDIVLKRRDACLPYLLAHAHWRRIVNQLKKAVEQDEVR